MRVEPRLTRRANEVAGLVALGLTNREIAERLHISERTVEWHLEQIMNKLGFTSRSQIAAWIGRSQLDTPVAKPSSRQRGNLPAQITSFVGRERELRLLLDLVTRNRLVTVTGAGGTGKTRLAIRLAEELQPELMHGAWLCDLAPLAVPELVADAVAHALSVKRSAPAPLDAVVEHLAERSPMLLLDNCEHVVAAAAVFAQGILSACPGVRILATSRIPLGVIGEAVCALEPLPQDDAVELFRMRTAAAVPDFRFEPGNADAVAAICRRVEGVPLAIELAAPRLRVRSVDELAAEVLDPAWQTPSADRHGSIDALIDWSYRVMDPDAQRLFRGLGTFSGWFDADDAAAITVQPAPTPILLASLVEQSMLTRDQQGNGRYRLLEILKAFARQRLEESGELESSRLRHARHMLSMAERSHGSRVEDAPLLHRMSAMVDDVRSALTTLLREDAQSALRLVGLITPSWRHAGRYQEALEWNQRTLAANPLPSAQRCRNLFHQAFTLAELGRPDEALPWLREAEDIADLPANESLRFETLLVRANTYAVSGDHPPALRLGLEAIERFQQEHDDNGAGAAMNHTALTLLSMGQFAEGANLAKRALALLPDLAPRRMATLDTLAQAHVFLGELREARSCWLEAVKDGIEIGWNNGIPFCMFGLALVAALDGEPERALQLHFAAERLNADLNVGYYDPIAPVQAEAIARATSEVGREAAERIRLEIGAIDPELLVGVVKATALA